MAIQDLIRSALEEVRDEIKQNISSTGSTASGRTADSMEIEVTGTSGILTGRQAFWTLERGRGPGRIPGNMIEIIKQWTLDKGISISPIPYIRQVSDKWQPKYTPEQRGMDSFAGAVAFKIANRGTQLYIDGGRDDIYTPAIEKAMNKLANNVLLNISSNLWQQQ